MDDGKTKQYILLVDELNMSLLGNIIPNLKFLEVKGRVLPDCDDYFLINPRVVEKPVVEKPIVEESTVQSRYAEACNAERPYVAAHFIDTKDDI